MPVANSKKGILGKCGISRPTLVEEVGMRRFPKALSWDPDARGPILVLPPTSTLVAPGRGGPAVPFDLVPPHRGRQEVQMSNGTPCSRRSALHEEEGRAPLPHPSPP